MAEEKQQMTYSDVGAINQVMKLVNVLMETDIDVNGDTYYIDGQIRLWSSGGWSPGYISMDNDWPMFVADYKEHS